MTDPDPDLDYPRIVLADTVQKISDEFDVLCNARHIAGQAEYLQLTFLEVDTLDMACEELADTVNYIRYTYIRARLLRKFIEERLSEGQLGSFTPAGGTDE